MRSEITASDRGPQYTILHIMQKPKSKIILYIEYNKKVEVFREFVAWLHHVVMYCNLQTISNVYIVHGSTTLRIVCCVDSLRQSQSRLHWHCIIVTITSQLHNTMKTCTHGTDHSMFIYFWCLRHCTIPGGAGILYHHWIKSPVSWNITILRIIQNH